MNVNPWEVHTHTQIYKVQNGAICCNVVRFGACDLELYIVKGFPKTDIFCDPDFLPGTCGKRRFPHGAHMVQPQVKHPLGRDEHFTFRDICGAKSGRA